MRQSRGMQGELRLTHAVGPGVRPQVEPLQKQLRSEETGYPIPFDPLSGDVAHLLAEVRAQVVLALPGVVPNASGQRGIQLLFDGGDGMVPFYRDQQWFREELARTNGLDGLEFLSFQGCPLRGVGAGRKSSWQAYRPPLPGTIVLVLTDLGIGAPMLSTELASAAEWIDFARMVKGGGCYPVALVPYAPDRWSRRLLSELTIVQWEQPTGGSPGAATGYRPVGIPTGPAAIDGRMRLALKCLQMEPPAVVRLAQALSLAAKIEPELLRAMRREVLPELDAGVEADLWFSSLVQSENVTGFVLMPEVVEVLRQGLAQEQRFLDRTWEVIERVHREAPPALRLEEEVTWLALSGRPGAEAQLERGLLSAVVALVEQDRTGLARWAARALPELPEQGRALPATWILALASSARIGRQVLKGVPPAAVMGETLCWALPRDVPSLSVGVRFLEDGVELGDPSLEESHHVGLPKTFPLLLELEVQTGGSLPHRELVSWRPGQSMVVPVPPGEITLRTAQGAVYLFRPA